MKVLLAVNNRLGWQAAELLRSLGAEVVGLVLHPPQKRKFGEEILAVFPLPPERVFDGARLDEGALVRIAALSPDICLSVLFGYIVRPPFISLFPKGVVNLHPAMLPYNRGANPNVWSIVEGTPAGTTLHYIDSGVDTGDIIAQKAVPALPWDTGRSLYERLETSSLELVREAWPALEVGNAPRYPQPKDGPTVTLHRTKDVAAIDHIDLDAPTTARRVIDVLRARTFPPYRGAFFEANGRKVFLSLHLAPEEE